MTAKEQLRRRVDDLTEAEALEALRVLERQTEASADRLDALLGSAPADDEPEDYDDDELTQEAREQAARCEVRSHDQVRRDLLGS